MNQMVQEAPEIPWYLFEIKVTALLSYLERKTGRRLAGHPDLGREANRWHLALRRGLSSNLHLDLGIAGMEQPVDPVVENACSLHAALLLGQERIKVVLSGEWHLAVREGLITWQQLEMHESALKVSLDGNEELLSLF
jgi:hypothetical protein